VYLCVVQAKFGDGVLAVLLDGGVGDAELVTLELPLLHLRPVLTTLDPTLLLRPAHTITP